MKRVYVGPYRLNQGVGVIAPSNLGHVVCDLLQVSQRLGVEQDRVTGGVAQRSRILRRTRSNTSSTGMPRSSRASPRRNVSS